jgi:hypothetical protein
MAGETGACGSPTADLGEISGSPTANMGQIRPLEQTRMLLLWNDSGNTGFPSAGPSGNPSGPASENPVFPSSFHNNIPIQAQGVYKMVLFQDTSFGKGEKA